VLFRSAGLAPLFVVRADYARIEAAVNGRLRQASARPEAWQREMDALLMLQRNSLFGPHVLVMLAAMMEPDARELGAKLDVCERAQRFAPSAHIVFKCAVLLQLAGRDADAASQLRRSLRAFPAQRQKAATELRALATRNPRIAPLARLAEMPPPDVQ
jgi:hypothetical protein